MRSQAILIMLYKISVHKDKYFVDKKGDAVLTKPIDTEQKTDKKIILTAINPDNMIICMQLFVIL